MDDRGERLKAHSALFAAMEELIPHQAKGENEKLSPNECVVNGFSVERVQSISLSALQERLKDKIEGFHKKRKVGKASAEGSKRANEVITQKKLKRVENHKKKKGHRQKEKLTNKAMQKRKDILTRPSVIDETGRMVFSKFDFSTTTREKSKLDQNPSNTKDLKKLLAKAESAQKKLEEIKKLDERKGEELEKKLIWQKALDMARGTKLKDDPKLLKKSAKRIEMRKKKSSKEWDKRKKQELEAREKRQSKRKRNIDERKEQVRSKKMKKRGRGGLRRTPGF